MAIFDVSVFYGKTVTPEKLFSLTFAVQSGNIAAVVALVESRDEGLAGMFYNSVTVAYTRVSTHPYDGFNYTTVPCNCQGLVQPAGGAFPPFVIARATASLGLGRPAVKQMRFVLSEGDVVDGIINPARRIELDGYLDSFTAADGDTVFGSVATTPDGEVFRQLQSGWSTASAMRSRQISRKRTSPGQPLRPAFNDTPIKESKQCQPSTVRHAGQRTTAEADS